MSEPACHWRARHCCRRRRRAQMHSAASAPAVRAGRRRRLGGAERGGRRPALAGAHARSRRSRRASTARQSVLHRRRPRPDRELRLAGRLALDAQRLHGRRRERGRRRRRGALRRRAQPAPRHQGARPQLPRRLQRAGFAAGLDAPDGRRDRPRRLHAGRLERRAGPGRLLRRGGDVAARLSGGDRRRGRYVQGGGCTTVGVAGLVQGGGFGSFSKGFGTAAPA